MAKFRLSASKKVTLVLGSAILLGITVLATNLDFVIKLIGGGDKSYINAGNTQNPYQIDIYYFPRRKPSAYALTDFFTQQGYLVNTLTAAQLENSKATQFSQSHFFFNKEDFSQAMGIKTQMQQVLGYPISAYKFSVSQQVPSMLIVFTDAETEGEGIHAPHKHTTGKIHSILGI